MARCDQSRSDGTPRSEAPKRGHLRCRNPMQRKDPEAATAALRVLGVIQLLPVR